jgi:hypothetical protein
MKHLTLREVKAIIEYKMSNCTKLISFIEPEDGSGRNYNYRWFGEDKMNFIRL